MLLGHTAASSGLFAATPQGILLVPEDRRATVPVGTVISWRFRRSLLGVVVPFPRPATAIATTASRTASSFPATGATGGPVKHPNEKASQRTCRSSIYPLPHPAPGRRR